MNKVRWLFLDDLSFGLTPKEVANALKKRGRYVRLVYFIEKEVSEVDTLRPLFELTAFKNGFPDFVMEQCPGYDEYLFVIFNSSVPHLLYHQPDRGVAQSMYMRIIGSFDIITDHFALYNGPERVPEEINRWEFVTLMTNRKFYTSKFETLESFVSYLASDPLVGIDAFKKEPLVEICELSFKNLSRV